MRVPKGSTADPVFPFQVDLGDSSQFYHGIYRRDLFALVAMHAIILKHLPKSSSANDLEYPKATALGARMYADALIAELAK
jgi:hypothetical protein